MAAIVLVYLGYGIVQKWNENQSPYEKVETDEDDPLAIILEEEEKEEEEGKASSDLYVSLATEKLVFTRHEPIPIKVTFTYLGESPIGVLKWHTPYNPVKDPILAIRAEKKNVDYLGPMRDYLEDPSEDDYLILSSGESFGLIMDLALYYNISSEGEYKISYNDVLTSFSSNSIEFKVV